MNKKPEKPWKKYVAEWLDTNKSGVTDKVYDWYLHYICDLTSECGDKFLKDVTTSDIQRVYNKRSGQSGSPIEKQAMTINAIF